MHNKEIVLVDCPRDAIQGMHKFIETEKKAAHINKLIRSELFEWIDFGSFVSPKAIPQMADTQQVLENIELVNDTKLIAIIANERGAETGIQFDKIRYLGYPFSISETFQLRNTNSGIGESFKRLQGINNIAKKADKEAVVYISMAFGNPYSDDWSEQLVVDWIGKIKELGIKEFSLADTTGEANPEQIKRLFEVCKNTFGPDIRIGAHFHSEKMNSLEKIKAAHEAGCTKFDGAILGYGGCPFAKSDLVGNIASEDLLYYFQRGNPAEISELQQSFREIII